MHFDIYNLTTKDFVLLEKLVDQAESRYYNAGYAKPSYALGLIDEAYNQLHKREVAMASKGYRGDWRAELAAKGETSPAISTRFKFFELATKGKLYNELYETFKDGNGTESFELSFSKGMPDEQTQEFFTLRDVTGRAIAPTTTSKIRCPESYHAEKDCIVTVTPQGDSMAIDGKTYGVGDPVIDSINAMMKNVDPIEQ